MAFSPNFTPCNKEQPLFFTRDLGDDVYYFLVWLVAYSSLATILLQIIFTLAYGGEGRHVLLSVRSGYGALSRLPVIAQAAILILGADVIQYWLHRALHLPALWPFHAVHHSARDVSFMTSYRVHPVDFIFSSTCVVMLLMVLGFSPSAFLIASPFNLITAALVHANLNWTFGPLRHVIASPVFHRWHHSCDPRLRDKNFAPTFPFLDLMFGTFHMPKGELPGDYGADGVPEHFAGQMLHPFRVLTKLPGRVIPS